MIAWTFVVLLIIAVSAVAMVRPGIVARATQLGANATSPIEPMRAAARAPDQCSGHGPFPHAPGVPACTHCGYWPFDPAQPDTPLWMPADPMELVAAFDRARPATRATADERSYGADR